MTEDCRKKISETLKDRVSKLNGRVAQSVEA